MNIPSTLINEIRSKVNIVEVIGSYLPLTKKGKNYLCVCPFHDDHDPSMSISEDKQIYHCFVCNSGGNVFKFVQEYEKISFQESVAKVAKFAGITLDDKYLKNNFVKKLSPKQKLNNEILNKAIEYCEYELNTVVATKQKQYLLDRNITTDIIEYFEIGYNPADNKLYKFLKGSNFKDEDLINSGVVSLGDYGIHDFFSDRIMIPIHDSYGNPVGFTARTINPDNQAKYINSAENEFYHKGSLLFNYHRVKKQVRKDDKVIVCEGAMDVIGFKKAGINLALATLGTACTNEQIKLLKQLNSQIVLFYDGDKAGQNAMYKLGKLAQSNFLNITIVKNDTGLDPDEIVDKYGSERLKTIIDNTQSYSEFLIDYLPKYKYNLENYNDRYDFAEELNNQLVYLNNDLEKNTLIDKVKSLTGITLNSEQSKREAIPLVKKPIKKQTNIDFFNQAQAMIVICMMHSKNVALAFNERLGYLYNASLQKLALYILDYYEKHDNFVISDFIDMINDEQLVNMIVSIDEWDEKLPNNQWEQLFDEAINKIDNYLYQNKINELKGKIEKAENYEDKLKYLNDLSQLRKHGGSNNG